MAECSSFDGGADRLRDLLPMTAWELTTTISQFHDDPVIGIRTAQTLLILPPQARISLLVVLAPVLSRLSYAAASLGDATIPTPGALLGPGVPSPPSTLLALRHNTPCPLCHIN